MASHTSDLVSLGEIDQELQRVRTLQEAQRKALADLDKEEVRLSSLLTTLREFVESRRSRVGEPHRPARDEARSAVFEVKPKPAESIVERAVEALKAQGEPLDTWPLIKRMQDTGYTSDAENIYLSVYGTINRATKRPKGPLIKAGKKWALREWYPDGVPEAPTAEVDLSFAEDEREEEKPMLIAETDP
jgi:hypothetical protein